MSCTLNDSTYRRQTVSRSNSTPRPSDNNAFMADILAHVSTLSTCLPEMGSLQWLEGDLIDSSTYTVAGTASLANSLLTLIRDHKAANYTVLIHIKKPQSED